MRADTEIYSWYFVHGSWLLVSRRGNHYTLELSSVAMPHQLTNKQIASEISFFQFETHYLLRDHLWPGLACLEPSSHSKLHVWASSTVGSPNWIMLDHIQVVRSNRLGNSMKTVCQLVIANCNMKNDFICATRAQWGGSASIRDICKSDCEPVFVPRVGLGIWICRSFIHSEGRWSCSWWSKRPSYNNTTGKAVDSEN